MTQWQTSIFLAVDHVAATHAFDQWVKTSPIMAIHGQLIMYVTHRPCADGYELHVTALMAFQE